MTDAFDSDLTRMMSNALHQALDRLRMIGLLNGDVISAINGLEMNSPDQALLAYTKLKTANHLSVSLERNGQKVTKDYNIR